MYSATSMTCENEHMSVLPAVETPQHANLDAVVPQCFGGSSSGHDDDIVLGQALGKRDQTLLVR